MHRFWEIPELVAFVPKELTVADQARLSRVSHSLWAASAPILWRIVNLYKVYELVTGQRYSRGDGVPQVRGL